MPRKEIYLNQEEWEYVEGKPRGFIRRLVQQSRLQAPNDDNVSVYVHPLKDTLNDRLEDIAKNRAKNNPNACRYCGRIKVAGKCLVCKK
jgi:hypothetical protein